MQERFHRQLLRREPLGAALEERIKVHQVIAQADLLFLEMGAGHQRAAGFAHVDQIEVHIHGGGRRHTRAAPGPFTPVEDLRDDEQIHAHVLPDLGPMGQRAIAFARIRAPGLGNEHVRAVRRGLQKLHEFFIERGHSLIRGQHAIFRNESREQIRRALGLFHADDTDLQIGEVRSAGRRLLTGRKQRYGYGQNRETEKTAGQSAHQSRLPLVLRTTLPVRETA